MNFEATFGHRNRQYFESACENWYQRLNKLKDKYGSPLLCKDEKAVRIMFLLISRIQACSALYLKLNSPTPNYPKGSFANGGVMIVGENGQPEIIKDRMKKD